jgi:hypothetical protein
MRFVRPSLGYTKLDHQTNVDVRETLKVQSLVKEVQTYQKNQKERVEKRQVRDQESLNLNTIQWQNEIGGALQGDGKTSSWKRVEEYSLISSRRQ